MYVCVTNGSWSRYSGVVRDYINDTQREKNIGFELKIILNLGYHLFSMFLNFTTSPNSLKRNTSLYSVWGTFHIHSVTQQTLEATTAPALVAFSCSYFI
jgi:hypothetical protein